MNDIDIIIKALLNMGDDKSKALADEIEAVREDATENGPDIFSGRVEERQPS